MLRSAIVNIANYYVRIAEQRSPAEMEAMIWQRASVDGTDHGASCAAFASLTLELAGQVVGQESWVTGGTSYPWPLHQWADARVDPNPASPGIISIRQDAQAHDRWHALGDGYNPLPGDWVLFDGHVEVVTDYTGGVLHTVGADSLPNFSVNAHAYGGALEAEGVEGFVNNGVLTDAANKPAGSTQVPSGQAPAARDHAAGGARSPAAPRGAEATAQAPAGSAAIPGTPPVPPRVQARAQAPGGANIPGLTEAPTQATPSRGEDGHAAWRETEPSEPAEPGSAAIPGIPATPRTRAADSPAAPYRRYQPAPPPGPGNDAAAQRAFIRQVAPGAMANQRRYGIPAAVTIAQAIEESGWGRSELAAKSNNLFGIKGKGPAGSAPLYTHEYEDGHWVTRIDWFRAYHNVAESIDDHGRLLASSEYYTTAMAVRQVPNAFATALTGVYATDPGYGAKLIGLMRQHDLYHYDVVAAQATSAAGAQDGAGADRLPRPALAAAVGTPVPSPTALASTPSHAARESPPFPAFPTSDPSLVFPTLDPSPARRRPAPSSPAGAPDSSPPPAILASAARPRLAARADVHLLSPQARRTAQDTVAKKAPARLGCQTRPSATRNACIGTSQYEVHIPAPVRSAFLTSAKTPLTRAEPLYRDVASHNGVRWELLAACDWMQCDARPRYSPVYGEKLGTLNPDGSVYRTRSAALARCADDLIELAMAVYSLDVAVPAGLSIRDLAKAFAAFRWGGLLKLHRTSAMEFPYSVAGLTAKHTNMRWPNIAERNTPDKPGKRFHMPFGAVPIVLLLDYPATL